MATIAYLEGRDVGYSGNVKAANPYRKGWVRIGLGDQLTMAEDWDKGRNFGRLLRSGTFAELMIEIGGLTCESC